MNKKILGIGNAIVDIFVMVDDHFLKKYNLKKGSMKLLNKSEFENFKKICKIQKIVAGGSVANTMTGISYLKGNASFFGKINNDALGRQYKKSLIKKNVKFLYNPKNEKISTGASIILITPDRERTMCTYLGISSMLLYNNLDASHFKDKSLIFLEGYLWDKQSSKKMFNKAIKISKENNCKVAMSLSDINCVLRHRKDFIKLLNNDLDILLGNEQEIIELTSQKNLNQAINILKKIKKLIIITRSNKGSLAITNNKIIKQKAFRIKKVIDLTGAGDLFAAGFLKKYLDGSDIKTCLKKGSILASKIIQKFGARIS